MRGSEIRNLGLARALGRNLLAMKVAIIGRWSLYGGQNEWGKALSGLTKVAFIERWPSYRVATIDRFHCTTYHIVHI